MAGFRHRTSTIRRARYQMCGNRKLRCISLASSAALSCACVPATAQLLLPTNGASSSATRRAAECVRAALRASPAAERRSKTSGPGIGGCLPLAADHRAHPIAVPSGCRKSYSGRGRRLAATSRARQLFVHAARIVETEIHRERDQHANLRRATVRRLACAATVYSHGCAAGALQREVDALPT